MGNRRQEDLELCGTPAAYRRHLRRGELVDPACRQAEALRYAERDTKLRRPRDMWRERYRRARDAGLSAREATRVARNNVAWNNFAMMLVIPVAGQEPGTGERK